jgi:chromosome segregation ATPase
MTMNDNTGQLQSLPLHERVTVVHASATDRARILAALPASLSTSVIELDAARPAAITASDLANAARALAAERYGQRRVEQRHLEVELQRALDERDRSSARRDELQTAHRHLTGDAAWCRELAARLDELADAAHEATAEVEQRRSAHREAQLHLERVREQQQAAEAAIEDADGQLSDLETAGLDDTGIRRELEAVKARVRAAEAAETDARAALAELTAREGKLRRDTEQLQAARARIADARNAQPVPTDAVRAALQDHDEAARSAAPGPEAAQLAVAWATVADGLEAARAERAAQPDASELEAATIELQAAEAALAELDAAPGRSLPSEERAALDAAHAAVLDAEDRVARGAGRSNARKRLDAARAHEVQLLADAGFESYLDVVLSGGRRGRSGDRLAAEQRHQEARQRYEDLTRRLEDDDEVQRLEREQLRIWDEITSLLGVDPGDQVLELLGAHLAVPAATIAGLAEALSDAGVTAVGVSLADVARAWLAEQDEIDALLRDGARRLEAVESAEAETRSQLERIVPQVATASARLQQSAEAVATAQRGVTSLEAELSARAGEDARRLQRLAAAEQLRAQVDTVRQALASAVADADREVEVASMALAAAEVALDRHHGARADAVRRLRRIAELVAADLQSEIALERPGIEALVTAVDAELVRLQTEITETERAVEAATRSADAASASSRDRRQDERGVAPQDHVDALVQLVDGPGSSDVAVLDDCISDLHGQARKSALDTLLVVSHHRPVVLLADEPDIVGWAIALPPADGAVVTAEALIDALRAPASAEDLRAEVRSDTDAVPAPPAGRTAGGYR